MTNYLLSIDPSIKNTGSTLWEKVCNPKCNYLWQEEEKAKHTNDIWKPILVTSYNFKKYSIEDFEYNIKSKIDELGTPLYLILTSYLNLIIERGFPNMKGSETQDHLRGFIAGIFNKLLTKDMLISPKEWQNWYIKNYEYCENCSTYELNCCIKNEYSKIKKLSKEISIKLAKQIIQEQE